MKNKITTLMSGEDEKSCQKLKMCEKVFHSFFLFRIVFLNQDNMNTNRLFVFPHMITT